MTAGKEVRLVLNNIGAAAEIFGRNDEHLVLIENNLGVRIVARGDEILILGDPDYSAIAEQVIKELESYYNEGNTIGVHEINYAVKSAQEGIFDALNELAKEIVLVTAGGRNIKPKTFGQKYYVNAMRNHDIVFSIGPAGTGKTFLAVCMAIRALKNKEVNKLVLTRPAVEAGEKLGFLPGDLQEKVDPYLRPLYDALYSTMGTDSTQKYIERRVIEIAPLAYMRGRTLEDSFIILDEAQNTTPEQMKMFLTRLGLGSKAVITGDITQIDLPKGQVSGLVNAKEVLKGIDGISFSFLTGDDVVRHPLVRKIIDAYEGNGSSQKG
ncbi:MAG TPA: PhoH family protein [Clostridia bacterium]|nr:PhoH family protein [Clostridia bacterium]